MSRDQILERFHDIEAALNDVLPHAVGHSTRKETEGKPELASRYRGRLYHLFVLINHLKDDANRIAKRTGKPKELVDKFVASHQALVLCERLAESHKHGLGGRRPNATILNGVLWAVKSPKGVPTSDDDPAIAVGMLIADGNHGSFHSDVVLVAALRLWIDFLLREFDIDLRAWEQANLTPRNKPVHLLPEHGSVVDPGALVMAPIPKELEAAVVEDVKKRSQAT